MSLELRTIWVLTTCNHLNPLQNYILSI